MLEKCVTNCHYSKGTRVRQAGTNKCGTVTKMFFNHEECHWVDDKPYFIEVTFDDGSVYACSLNQLTKKQVQ